MKHMMDGQHGYDSAVDDLLAERTRYEEWLHTLEQRRDTTPPHIYSRVHSDYSERLQRVYERLGAHRDTVERMINDLLERIASLEREQMGHRDERSEAELRGMIGEYDEERCAEIIRSSDEEIATIESAKAEVESEVARLRGVLDGAAPPAAGHHQEAPSGEEAPRELPADDDADAETPEWARPAVQTGNFDELEFLRAVGEASSATHAAEQQAGENPAREEVASAEDDGALHLEEERESMPSFLRSSPPEQAKTLKCQECGTMNYPTEWYCERCGAELAAL